MAEKKKKNKGMRAGRSLNLILWLSFSLFAVILVAVYAVVQNIFVHRQYQETALNILTATGKRLSVELQQMGGIYPMTGKIIFEEANRSGVGVYVLYPSGNSVFPELTEQSAYPEIAEYLDELLDINQYTTFTYDDDLCFASFVETGVGSCFLYLFMPLQPAADYLASFRWMSVITALFAIVMAFATSGLVSKLITRPVTEVTEQAKELARGNFNLNFRKEYFCSEMTELSFALDSARREISKANQMEKELIANVSHDFKTPLTMIKAYASMIREISGEDKVKRDAHAQIIIDESDHLAALVSDLLDLSKLRAGLSADDSAVFNLSEEVYRVVSRFSYLSESAGYSFETAVEEGIYAFACRERIEQVLYNLIGNAVNYTGEDKKVRVVLTQKEGFARFEVIDTGKGIPPEELDTIWERYTRSSKTHKRPVQGTGLGLSIVKSILLSQKCPFGVNSEVGKGSCFWVEIPVPKDNPFADGDKSDAPAEFLK